MRILLVLLLAACGPKTPVTATPVAATPVADPAATAMLPPVFDAATLREGFPVGTVLKYRIVEAGIPRIEEWTVTTSDDAGCAMHTKVFTPDGALTEESDNTNTWVQLESHGTFPAATTTRSDSTWDMGISRGPYATWYYEELPAEPGGMTRRFHFAPDLVGPPVWAEFRQGDVVIVTMELLARTGP